MSYEDFVLHSAERIAESANIFNLPAVEAMKRAAMRPSLSTKSASDAEVKAAIARSDHNALLTRWRTKVDEETERSVMQILEVLEINLYRAGSPVATIGRRPAKVPA